MQALSHIGHDLILQRVETWSQLFVTVCVARFSWNMVLQVISAPTVEGGQQNRFVTKYMYASLSCHSNSKSCSSYPLHCFCMYMNVEIPNGGLKSGHPEIL